MSKTVKNMLISDLRTRLRNVGEVLTVSLGRLDAQQTSALRKALRTKRIELRLVKTSLARLATADSPLAPAFADGEGMLAVAWGGEDIVDLAKEINRIAGLKEFEGFECRGGALDGARLGPDDVKLVAKWPSRGEQLSILSGQISSLGGLLSAQITSVGGLVAGQIQSRIEDLEKPGTDEAAPAA